MQAISYDPVKISSRDGFATWRNLQIIVDKWSGTIQYAQDGVVFFEYHNDDFKTGQNWV